MATIADYIVKGTNAARLALTLDANQSGFLFFESDTLKMYRWDGSGWDLISDAGAVAADFIKKDGSVAFTGNQSLGTNRLTNVGDPSGAQDAATKAYVDGIAANLGKRARVRAATTANITIATALNNGDALDGVTLATGDLVLVKDQTAAEENGVYTVGVSPARADEFNTYDEHPGSLIAVQEGTANEDTLWLCTSNVGGVLGTNDIDFSPFTVGGNVEGLSTAETDTSLVLAPDGAGGLEFRAETGGAGTSYILIQDQKAQNTSGGTFTSGSWQTRDLNTEVVDTGNNASVSSNQITLEAGTYRFRISCPALRVDNHQARLYNISDSTVVAYGTSEFNGSGGYQATTRSIIEGRFTIAGSKVFEVQHRCVATFATVGLGAACNLATEIYTTAEFEKE